MHYNLVCFISKIRLNERKYLRDFSQRYRQKIIKKNNSAKTIYQTDGIQHCKSIRYKQYYVYFLSLLFYLLIYLAVKLSPSRTKYRPSELTLLTDVPLSEYISF